MVSWGTSPSSSRFASFPNKIIIPCPNNLCLFFDLSCGEQNDHGLGNTSTSLTQTSPPVSHSTFHDAATVFSSVHRDGMSLVYWPHEKNKDEQNLGPGLQELQGSWGWNSQSFQNSMILAVMDVPGGAGGGGVCPPCCLGVRVFISTQSIREVQIEETNAFMALKGPGDLFSLRFCSSYMPVSPPRLTSPRVASFPIWLQGSGNW